VAALLILSLACGLATGLVARARGRSFPSWLIWGTIFAPFAMPIVVMMRKR
jgi:hypothetical protein